MDAKTPHALIKHLARYITDDGAIAAHVKREFGITVSYQRIREIRAEMIPTYKGVRGRTWGNRDDNLSSTYANTLQRARDERFVERLRAVHG